MVDGPLFFLTAAEHSGDALGAALIGALRRRFPGARFAGVGGDLMAAAGCELLENPVRRSAMLVGALVTEFWYWKKLLRRIDGELARRMPAVVVPIDSSFINLRIAARAKRRGLPVCYYVAPQVWASRPWRVRKIRKCVDTLCCVLPFEEAYFRRRGVRGVYVGHPMFDVPVVSGQRSVPSGQWPADNGPRVAVFPGSRRAEVEQNMPAMLKVLAGIRGRYAGAKFVAAAVSAERGEQIRRHVARGVGRGGVEVEVRVGDGEAVIRWADLVVVKSGTGTLEVARQGRPMVVMFAVPRWQWAVARWFIVTRWMALVNILAGREVVREFIPFYGPVGPVVEECLGLLSDEGRRGRMVEELRGVVAGLMPTGGRLAADRVAEEVERVMRGDKVTG